MAQQQFHYDTWYLDLGSGEAKSQMYAPQADQSAWLTGAWLVDPESVAAGKSVRVALRTQNDDDDQISVSFVLSTERPHATLGSAVMLEDNFWLEREDDDCADAAVQFVGCRALDVLATLEIQPVEDHDGEEESADQDEEIVLATPETQMVEYEVPDDVYEEIVFGSMYESTVPEDSREESDGEFSVSVSDIPVLLQMVHTRKFVPEAWFPRCSMKEFAAAGNTAGFMRVTATDTDIQGGGDNRGKQITVLYRYNCFSAASIVGGEACRVEQRHQFRFFAPASHEARTSLAWAGVSLASLIYPGHSSYLLQELWSSLITEVSIPVHATRVVVFMDVGILRPADCTQERMEHMISTLQDMLMRPWHGCFNGIQMHLPEPVRCVTQDEAAAAEDPDTEERPAKRRRVVPAGESCTVCLEALEGDDLAAWPRCGKPHVFHAACMESLLQKYTKCPICRRSLFVGPTF